MCIRDSVYTTMDGKAEYGVDDFTLSRGMVNSMADMRGVDIWVCLLYTSDAADERSSGDLGGRRLIKKKKDCTVEDTDKRRDVQQQY